MRVRLVSEVKLRSLACRSAALAIATCALSACGLLDDTQTFESVTFCNFTPYSNSGLVALDTEIISVEVAPGACSEIGPFEAEKVRGLAGVAQDSSQLRYIETEYNTLQEWGGLPYWGGYSDEFLCLDGSGGVTKNLPEKGECRKDAIKLDLSDTNPNQYGHSIFHFIDPYICTDLSFDCNEQSISVLSRWSQSLSVSMEKASEFEAMSNGVDGIIPFATGFAIRDVNGPFEQGVIVTQALERTPLGSLIAVREGDIILEYNNVPIFDKKSFATQVWQHARQKGFSNPYSLLFARDADYFEAEGFQFFHKNPYGRIFQSNSGHCKAPHKAALIAALEEASFYTQSTLSCILYLGDRRNLLEDRCVFYMTQLIAAYRQFCPDETMYATVVGGMFFPGRDAADAALKGFALRGMSSPARMLRAAVIEGAEEAVRTAVTLPPGFDISDNIDTIQSNSGLAAVIGSGFSLVAPGGVKGVLK